MPRIPTDMVKAKAYAKRLSNKRLIERKQAESDKKARDAEEQRLINRLKREHGAEFIQLSRRGK